MAEVEHGRILEYSLNPRSPVPHYEKEDQAFIPVMYYFMLNFGNL